MDNATDWTSLLQEHFGFAQFRPGQLDAIRALETTGRALAVFPTGAGKSLCYQLPALTYAHLTLVVSPLIALMKDQIDFLRKRGIAAARLDSSLSLDELRGIQDEIHKGRLKLLYVAPERFKNERFLEMISQQKISLFAIDEAHCISEWGHNFRPDYLKLADTAKSLGAERILALTATATPAVVKDICARFAITPEAAIVTGFYRPNLRLAITGTATVDRDALLLKRLQTRQPGSTIVYVTLQKTAEVVATYLRDAGLDAQAYHAGMDPDARVAVQERWMASDAGIIVATIAFGMGIDKADVRYVYHYNLAKSIENYSQEIGRAGRDGAASVVEMFASVDDIPTLENFVYGDTPTDEALHSLVHDVMSRDEQFSLSLYELADKHDIRQLVLRTALTYLELLGAIKEGAPYYAGYRFYPTESENAIFSKFSGERGDFIRQIFSQGKKGRKWLSLNPDDVAVATGQPRQRIVKALDYLHDQRDIVLEASEVRSRFVRLSGADEADNLAEQLLKRFSQRENDEISRIDALLKFVEHRGCHANALAAYFGEIRDEPCGQCAQCVTGKPVVMPPSSAVCEAFLSGDELDELNRLMSAHPKALRHFRQVSRFLCGIASPAVSKAKLGKHPLFGKLEQARFAEVLKMANNLGLE